ncbi:hypothetical protein ACFQS4_11755 [Saliphagus sp. GCM10025317]
MTDDSYDSADENDGKYSTETEMTFEGLLKTSLRERAEHKQILSDAAENPQQSSESKFGEKTTRTSDEQEREESASNQRMALATSIGKAHVSNRPSLTLAGGETKAIGHHTTYELARTDVNNRTYYYVAQTTDQSYERHHAELAIKDFGTTWSYDVPEADQEAIQQAIREQRQRDLRAGREPVEWLTSAQLDTVSEWYRSRTELEFLNLEERHRKDEESIHVVDQYLIADMDRKMLLSGGDLRELTDRQVTVVLENLIDIVHPNIELLPALDTNLRQRMEYPLLARITFDE